MQHLALSLMLVASFATVSSAAVKESKPTNVVGVNSVRTGTVAPAPAVKVPGVAPLQPASVTPQKQVVAKPIAKKTAKTAVKSHAKKTRKAAKLPKA